jgi:hypothetical protein
MMLTSGCVHMWTAPLVTLEKVIQATDDKVEVREPEMAEVQAFVRCNR